MERISDLPKCAVSLCLQLNLIAFSAFQHTKAVFGDNLNISDFKSQQNEPFVSYEVPSVSGIYATQRIRRKNSKLIK